METKEFYLKVKKQHALANINYPAKPGDCGYDCYSTCDLNLEPGERFNMPLGLSLEFPDGYVCLVNQKSGISEKYGLDTIGNVIDSGYRGIIHAQLVNTSKEHVFLKKGKKICQLLFMPFVKTEIQFVEELSNSERGENGFGSTN